jgi:hypothetical protein
MLRNLSNRLFFDNSVVEFDGTHYNMPTDIFSSNEWKDIIELTLPTVTESELVEILEVSESLDPGWLEPDMVTEEIALGDIYLMITPMSVDTVYVEYESSDGHTVGYQLNNNVSIDTFLIWIGSFNTDLLDSLFTYIESINPSYSNEFTLS